MLQNEINNEEVAKLIERIDAADDELLKLASEHMIACKGPRGRIRDVMKQAKDVTGNVAAFKALVQSHRASRKIEEMIAELENDDKADFELMQAALGDFGTLPLGEAALQRAKARNKPSGDAVVDNLRG